MSATKGVNISEYALNLYKNLPKINPTNVKLNPGEKRKRPHVGKRGHHGHSPRGAMQQLAYKFLGYEGGNTPFYKRIPIENSYNFGHHVRREYPSLSLYQLQLMIDTGRIDPTQPIDLLKILNTKIIKFDRDNYYGINLIDKGMDLFCAKVNIEVQWASELVIAAVEKAGGNIITSYYDPLSLSILKNPLNFFAKGEAIPRRLFPPKELVDYYSNPANRGYLVPFISNSNSEFQVDINGFNSASIALWAKKLETAQKFGYDIYFHAGGEQTGDLPVKITLENINDFWKQPTNSNSHTKYPPFPSKLFTLKNPTQIFEGINPGWVVNLKDKLILKPKGDAWKTFYGGMYMN
ncbi:unnamed protein product [Gordionus sp. m RMFG-2023]|uniref:large ribosomal subunit protein uL15m-like n=1 Tax=Gordionus sp. m RMFG-2023 TaxID=3053472 RepID=UPI0030DF5045